MWLSTEAIKNMKDLGYSFEEVEELAKRIEDINSWKTIFLDEDTFWNEVYANINSKMKSKCIK